MKKKIVNLIERERKKVKYLHFAKKTSKKFTKLNLNYIFVYALREKKNRLNLAVKKFKFEFTKKVFNYLHHFVFFIVFTNSN